MSGFGIEMKTQAIQSRIGSQIERLQESSSSEKSGEAGTSFGDTLKGMMEDVNTSQLLADQKTEELAAGRNKDLHGSVLAMEKADINFRMLTQVRNKVIEAYREVMRMQV
jgi:flagellar hook-basal body complex protein FliE